MKAYVTGFGWDVAERSNTMPSTHNHVFDNRPTAVEVRRASSNLYRCVCVRQGLFFCGRCSDIAYRFHASWNPILEEINKSALRLEPHRPPPHPNTPPVTEHTNKATKLYYTYNRPFPLPPSKHPTRNCA